MGSGSSVELEKARAQDAPDDASDFTTLFDARKEIVRMRELLLDPLSDPALKAAAAAPKSRVEASTSPLQLSALTQADPTYLMAKPRAVAEISVPNLRANLDLMREKCERSGLKMMLMLSADAFGCGIAMTTRLAMQAGVDVFGVSTLEDALKLRHAGIYAHDARVVVMGPVDTSEFGAFIKHEVEFLIQSIGTVQRVLNWCTSKSAVEVRSHVHACVRVCVSIPPFFWRFEQRVALLIGMVPLRCGHVRRPCVRACMRARVRARGVCVWLCMVVWQEYGDHGALLCHVLLNNPSNKTAGLNFAPEYRWHSTQTIKQLLTVTDPATQEKHAKSQDITGWWLVVLPGSVCHCFSAWGGCLSISRSLGV